MLEIMNEDLNAVAKTTSDHTVPFAVPGQIWRDGNPGHNNRLLLVVEVNNEKVVLQSFANKELLSVGKEEFNRRGAGYSYEGNLPDISEVYDNHLQPDGS